MAEGSPIPASVAFPELDKFHLRTGRNIILLWKASWFYWVNSNITFVFRHDLNLFACRNKHQNARVT